ncbi:MAG: hypothetical protein F4213_05735, partial [Boseongicola sp. SB0677_bin_26]|nr:hypothetical protein [Boseongicola sp. SB0677_bin_26]
MQKIAGDERQAGDMGGFQRQKDVVRAFHAALDEAGGDGVTAVLEDFSGAGFRWRGFHPFGVLDDVRDVSDRFWKPLKRSL